MKEIKLTQGAVALVDDEDFEEINDHKWYFHHGYAERNRERVCGVKSQTGMYTAIIGKACGLEIDHINGNKLDNRRCNLRHVTHAQNLQNKLPQGGLSKYKGVCWHNTSGKWQATIRINKKRVHIGCYKNEEDAARAYNEMATQYFGKYARLNIVQEEAK